MLHVNHKLDILKCTRVYRELDNPKQICWNSSHTEWQTPSAPCQCKVLKVRLVFSSIHCVYVCVCVCGWGRTGVLRRILLGIVPNSLSGLDRRTVFEHEPALALCNIKYIHVVFKHLLPGNSNLIDEFCDVTF